MERHRTGPRIALTETGAGAADFAMPIRGNLNAKQPLVPASGSVSGPSNPAQRAWAENALPLRFWQSRQWQTDTRTGSPSQIARSWPHRHVAIRIFILSPFGFNTDGGKTTTMGGEPTFVAIDDPGAPEWQTAASWPFGDAIFTSGFASESGIKPPFQLCSALYCAGTADLPLQQQDAIK